MRGRGKQQPGLVDRPGASRSVHSGIHAMSWKAKCSRRVRTEHCRPFWSRLAGRDIVAMAPRYEINRLPTTLDLADRPGSPRDALDR